MKKGMTIKKIHAVLRFTLQVYIMYSIYLRLKMMSRRMFVAPSRNNLSHGLIQNYHSLPDDTLQIQGAYIMKGTAVLIGTLIFSVSGAVHSGTGFEGRKLIHLESETARVTVDLGGGSIIDFHLIDQRLNPLTWNHPEEETLEPRGMGHFVCFDRLGNPSPREIENGMPFHGEASHVEWQVLSPPVKRDGNITAEMSCELPLAGMRLKRTMCLDEDNAVLTIREEATNTNKLGRVYNIVQHPSLGAPFLDESILIDCNAVKGFWTGNPMPYVEEPSVYWPHIVYGGKLVDLRCFTDNDEPSVVSFVCPEGDEYGWVTACNPERGLLLGYHWKLSDYPWIRIWRRNRDGKPLARGIEFGTTPLPLPFSDILAKGKIFGRPVYEYIDAGENTVKSYTAFLVRIPDNYRGVNDIVSTEDKLTLKEYGDDSARDIAVILLREQ